MALTLERIDHIHLYVADRTATTKWNADVLGLHPVVELEFWAPNGGPLTISNPSGTIQLAIFERPAERCRSTIAFGSGAVEFLAWRARLTKMLERSIKVEDHQVSWTMYFNDPDGNPFEITTHEYNPLILSNGNFGAR